MKYMEKRTVVKQYHIPRKELTFAIDSIWFQESKAASEELQYPSLQAEMIFNIGNDFALYNPASEKFFYQKDGNINGINTCPTKKEWGDGHMAMGIKFRPWGLFHLFGWNAALFSSKIISLSTVFQEKDLTFSRDISLNIPSINERVVVLEEFLLKSSCIRTVPQDLLAFIEDMHATSTIKRYLKNNKLSHSTFNAHFKRTIGIGVKEFLVMKRIQDTINDIQSNKALSLTEIAYLHGFYDQAHFIRSFSRYTGMTPLEFKNKPTIN